MPVRVKFGAVLGSWIKVPALAPNAIDMSPDVQIEANLHTEPFFQATNVIDGLGFAGQSGCDSSAHLPEAGLEGSEGLDVAADHLPNLNTVDFSWMTSTAVKGAGLMPVPLVKFRALWKAGSETRTRSAVLLDPPQVPADALSSFLPQSLPVRVGTPRFIRVPHSRRSMDLSSLGVQESERLVHEAETVRGIEHGQGELLAVFLSVPVEVISQVRFVEETKQLLYTLTQKPEMTRTRVHDMLAVRDRKTGETHLVPHRTRYRMAFLA